MTNAPTVLVHVGENFRTRKQGGRHTWILDMNPSTTTIDGMGQGQSFTDPAGGLTFRVDTLTPQAATISVENAADTTENTCIDGSVLTGPPPTDCTTSGSGVGGATGSGGATGAGGATGTAGGTGSGGPQVVSLTLIDADKDVDLFTLSEGQVLDLRTLPANLTLRADTEPASVGSVAFEMDGASVRLENAAPYSFAGDDGPAAYRPWELVAGKYSVTASPFTAASGSGIKGTALTRSFTLSNGDALGGGTGDGTNGASGSDAGGAPNTGGSTPSLGGGRANPSGGKGPALQQPSHTVEGECTCRVIGQTTKPAAVRWLAALALFAFASRRRRSRA
jgi:hypothetical protein